MVPLTAKVRPEEVISLVKESQQKKQEAKNDLANANEAVKDAEARQKFMESLEKELNAE
jgi:hypothetical protein